MGEGSGRNFRVPVLKKALPVLPGSVLPYYFWGFHSGLFSLHLQVSVQLLFFQSRHHICKGLEITFCPVGLQCVEVGQTRFFFYNNGQKSICHQLIVQKQASGSAISINKGVDSHELPMCPGGHFNGIGEFLLFLTPPSRTWPGFWAGPHWSLWPPPYNRQSTAGEWRQLPAPENPASGAYTPPGPHTSWKFHHPPGPG